ncbi:MAG: PVC-type heme-binding CxxCH protein [Gemmataceae bacterium]
MLLLALPALWLMAADTDNVKVKPVTGPLSPADAVKQFRVAPGLRIELVAAEPNIESPVAMAFDEDGKLWVVEMRDYPNGPTPGQPPQGRIRVLEDRDGDGYYEQSSIFADGLLFANGLLPWKRGVIVTAAPHILYLRDSTGDGRADGREVLYEGFAEQNPQLRVSHPLLGIDNWIYVTNGLRGGQVIRSGQKDAQPINLSGMDFRFDVIADRAEAISGMGQFGNTFDDWGQRFVCDNRHHLRHVVLENRYLHRNPLLAVPAVVEDTSILPDGKLNSGGRIYPLSQNWTTSNLHAGQFTAACGVFIYRGNLLPPEQRGTVFTCDPTGNLVHQERFEARGATFRSYPTFEKSEFLATPDDWCRPVFLSHGPDGALYVVDMYRAVIEHPDFMPVELKNRPDLWLGKDRGRIWRIVPEKHQTKGVRPALSGASIEQLASLLEHADVWWRTTAQRLLLERQDPAAVAPLRRLATTSPQPLARMHAAWLLHSLGALEEVVILELLRHEHPRVREHGVLLAEPRLVKSASLRQQVLELAEDTDARLRFQVALSLGEWNDDRIVPALAAIALAGAEDRWTRYAVASAIPQRAGALVVELLQPKHQWMARVSEGRLALLQELAALVGGGQDTEEIGLFLKNLTTIDGKESDRWQRTGLIGLTEGMGRRGAQLGTFLDKLPESQHHLATQVRQLLNQSVQVASNQERSSAERLEAIRLLAHASFDDVRAPLEKLLRGDPLPQIRLEAVRALSSFQTPEIPKLLLANWSTYSPSLRQEVASALLRQPARIAFLLDELEGGRVSPRELDPLSIRRLLNHGQSTVRERAKKILSAAVPAERRQVIESYRASLNRKGDAVKGKEIFRQNCAACHHIAGIGMQAGPDISDTRTKTPEMLLLDILDPNAAIDANYVNYLITTKDGKIFTGIIGSETASSITLLRGDNQKDVILRQDIDEILSSGQSLMPEGLEKNITVEQMADLLAFLKNWRYLDGAVPMGVHAP